MVVGFAVEAPTPAVLWKCTRTVTVAPAAQFKVLPVTPVPEKLQVTPFAGRPGQLNVNAGAKLKLEDCTVKLALALEPRLMLAEVEDNAPTMKSTTRVLLTLTWRAAL